MALATRRANARRVFLLTALIRFSRITIMTDKIKTTNPYSGQSEMLTKEEHTLYLAIKTLEKGEMYDAMQRGLDKFSRMNPKAYMTLLD